MSSWILTRKSYVLLQAFLLRDTAVNAFGKVHKTCHILKFFIPLFQEVAINLQRPDRDF